MAQIHVITGPERHRRWAEDEKRAIVAAAFAPGAVVTQVARRADVCASQIYRWRRDLAAARNGFAEVVVLPDRTAAVEPPATAIEVELADRVRIRIPPTTPPELAAAVVKALTRPVCRSRGEGR